MVSRVGVALPLALLVCHLSSPDAAAQLLPVTPDTSTVRVHLGPLLMNPTVALNNVGIDTNVFNEPTTGDPKQDFTMTLSPAADLWVRAGRAWLTGTVRGDAVWFQKYSSERSSNLGTSVGVVAPLSLIGVAADASWRNTRERPGYEIDARAERSEASYVGIVEVRAFPKTLLGARVTHTTVDYAEDAVYLGTSLEQQLNRDVTTAMFTVRNELTPLTSLWLEVGRGQERYQFAPERDADATDVSVALRFDPQALLNGTARFGLRHYDPHAGDLPVFKGFTTAVDVTYIAAGSTKLTLGLQRNVEQSFQVTQPYYVLTGITASVAQQIYGPIEAVGRVNAQRLAYRDRGVLVDQAARIDHVRSFGGGGGYHLGTDVRIGFNVDHFKRTSILEGREYQGLRFGASLSYGQ